VALTTLVVVLTQRPRPEYMYGLTAALMLLTGVCVAAILRWRGWMRFASACAGVVTVVLVIALPSYYQPGPRPLHDAVQRLGAVRGELQRPGATLIAANFNFEICSYLAASFDRSCRSPSWAALQARLLAGIPIRRALAAEGATAIYAEALMLANPAIARLVAAPEAYGWRQVAAGAGNGGPWHVLVRAS
jgi:hypothetical protein